LSNQETKLLVLEFGSGGHSLVYLSRIASVALNVGDRIAIASSINQSLIGAFHGSFENINSVQFLDPGSLWKRKKKVSARAEETFCGVLTGFSLRRQLGNSALRDWKIFFSNFPTSRFLFLRGLLSVFRGDWGAFLVNAPFLRNSLSDRRTERLLRRKQCRSIFTLDEGSIEWIKSSFPQAQSNWLPDFSVVSAKDGPIAKSLRERAAGRPTVLLIGRISGKKGLAAFLELSQEDSLRDFFFAIVGKCEMPGLSSWTRDRIVNHFHPRENTFFWGEEIDSEEEYNRIIQDSSLVWLVFPGFTNSSNTLTKAAFLKSPCIALADSLIGERVTRYSLGVTVREPIIDDAREVLLSMRQWKILVRKDGSPAREDFLREFNEACFTERLESGLRVFLDNR